MKKYNLFPQSLMSRIKKLKSLNIIILLFLGSIAYSGHTKAQSTYKDFTPDLQLLANDSLQIDINEDGIIDFELFYDEVLIPGTPRKRTFRINTNSNCKVAMKNDSVAAFLRTDTIGDNDVWSTSTESFIQYVTIHGYDGIIEQRGNWSNLPSVPGETYLYNGYMGFRLEVDNEIHYAWLRVNFNIENSIFALDLSYNNNPNEIIITGKNMPQGATSLITDILYSYSDEDKFMAKLTIAEPSENISQYRMIIAKENDETADNIEVMNSLTSQYYHIPVEQSYYNRFQNYIMIPIGANDKDGDPITRFTNYKLHVLNIASSGNEEDNILSTPSEVFYLESTTEFVNYFSASDSGNNNSSEDISVNLNTVNDKDFVSEYRIFVNKVSHTEEFTADIALGLSDSYYTSIASDEDAETLNLKVNQLDIDGDNITDNVDYKAYILSVADGILSVTSALSESSTPFRLSNSNLYQAGRKTGDGVNYFECDSTFSNFPHWTGESVMYSQANTNIDLNKDGIVDFNFIGDVGHTATSSRTYLGLVGLRENKVIICDHPEHDNWIQPLQENNMISEYSNWSTDTAILMDYHFSEYSYISKRNGHFSYQHQDYYIGLSIMVDETPQYAWLRINHFRYMEYGFQDIKSGLEELNKSSILLYPNPSSDIVNINYEESSFQSAKLNISILNSSGIIVQEISKINNNSTINVEEFSKGLYLFVIKDKQRIIETQKIIIE